MNCEFTSLVLDAMLLLMQLTLSLLLWWLLLSSGASPLISAVNTSLPDSHLLSVQLILPFTQPNRS